MMDKEKFQDELLPQTGITREMERALSSIFIDMPTYGTRSTALIIIDNQNVVDLTKSPINLRKKTIKSIYLQNIMSKLFKALF